MSEPNYNLTTTFYAKWILPFILILIGVGLIFLFFPGVNFKKGLDYDTKEEKIFYVTKIDGVDSFVEVKEKEIYVIKNKGSYEYYYNTKTVYEKHVPWYSAFRMNLAMIGTAGGAGLTIVGTIMLLVNVFNKISKVNVKKANLYQNNDKEDDSNEEDDE